jgi:hypothetical protein
VDEFLKHSWFYFRSLRSPGTLGLVSQTGLTRRPAFGRSVGGGVSGGVSGGALGGSGCARSLLGSFLRALCFIGKRFVAELAFLNDRRCASAGLFSGGFTSSFGIHPSFPSFSSATKFVFGAANFGLWRVWTQALRFEEASSIALSYCGPALNIG